MSSDISEESLLSTALDNYVLDNYETALNQINSLITKFESSPQKSEYLLYKAVCLLKLGKFEDALKVLDEIEKDTNFKKTLSYKKGNYNYKKEYNYYLTRGKILFYLCKFEESKTAFNTGLELNKENGNLFNDWIKKVEEELKP